MRAEYIDHLGSDLTVVNAARVSMDKESSWEIIKPKKVTGVGLTQNTKTLPEKDKKLLKYLATHNHWTPFSHPQITMRETVPIFVARQRFKHQVGFTYNEVSRRYVDDEPEFYVPEVWRSRPEGSIKQGSGDKDLSDAYCLTVIQPDDCWNCDEVEISVKEAYAQAVEKCHQTYLRMIDKGVAPEQARMILPQSMYTSYYVTGSLAAWARAYKQRIDPHAQVEIQDLARQWDTVIRPLYPESWEALTR